MLDIEMLDTLARGDAIPVRDGRPVFLEEIFPRVVADGWAPRNPAPADELWRLQESKLSGRTDCLHPLLQKGDVLYSDPNSAPLPGDIVCFKLSERGANAQNGDAPKPGSRVWRKGDGWAKLYCRVHGLDMLLTRFHGNCATATMLACEHPDDTPVLHPVRQIVRDGKPLFVPYTHSPQVTDNAATDIVEVSLFGYTGSAIAQAIATATVGPKIQPYTATVTVSADIWKTSANSAQVYLAQLSGGIPVGVTSQSFFVTGTSSPGTRISIVSSFSVAAGVSTQFALWYSSGTVGNFGNASNIDLRVDCIKK